MLNVRISKLMCTNLLEMMNRTDRDVLEGTIFLDPIFTNYCEIRFSIRGIHAQPVCEVVPKVRSTETNAIEDLVLHDTRLPRDKGWTEKDGHVVRIDNSLDPDEKGKVIG